MSQVLQLHSAVSLPPPSLTWVQPPCRPVLLTLSYIRVTGWRVTACRIPKACSGPQRRISDLEGLGTPQTLPPSAGPWPALGSKGLETTDASEGGGSKRHTERAASEEPWRL